jgi:5-methyltetrahydrofolate--homocysteine methyltransferase
LSNVSFGLPERGWVNTAFFAMAIGRGLTAAIANPSGEMIMNIKRACDVLITNDLNSKEYIAHFTKKVKSEEKVKEKAEEKPTDKKIYTAVLKGDRDPIKRLLETALQEGITPQKIVDEILIPAITQVGQLFDSKEYYLPQLIQSAETMKIAFEYLEPLLKSGSGEDAQSTVGVVLATVKGDIHDIGKNIVALMLKNYGFKVYDLGKDVDAQEIIQKVKETGAKIVGLSALMTTTMVEMGEVIRLAKSEDLNCKFMIGGAVVDEKFAEEIGADGYSEDAYAAVKLAQKLSGR